MGLKIELNSIFKIDKWSNQNNIQYIKKFL